MSRRRGWGRGEAAGGRDVHARVCRVRFWNSIGARRKQAKINTMAWMQRLKELAAKRSADDGNAGASAGGAVRVTRVQDSSVTGRQRQGNVRRVAPSS